MDKKHFKFIKAIEYLRTIFVSTKENSVDSFLDDLEVQAEENRKKIEGLGNV